MGFKSDIEIAQECEMQPITKIAEKAGIDDKYLEQYGKYKAKIDYNLLKESDRKDGKLILMTAINPTPAGEGKTTTTVGLADAMQKLGKSVMVALREPSLGPVFGVKGGAAGGGYAQVVPMEDINLHFTGDFHAIGAANNLLAAMIDNHIFQGNALNIEDVYKRQHLRWYHRKQVYLQNHHVPYWHPEEELQFLPEPYPGSHYMRLQFSVWVLLRPGQKKM